MVNNKPSTKIQFDETILSKTLTGSQTENSSLL
jgi:hypothetical protein